VCLHLLGLFRQRNITVVIVGHFPYIFYVSCRFSLLSAFLPGLSPFFFSLLYVFKLCVCGMHLFCQRVYNFRFFWWPSVTQPWTRSPLPILYRHTCTHIFAMNAFTPTQRGFIILLLDTFITIIFSNSVRTYCCDKPQNGYLLSRHRGLALCIIQWKHMNHYFYQFLWGVPTGTVAGVSLVNTYSHGNQPGQYWWSPVGSTLSYTCSSISGGINSSSLYFLAAILLTCFPMVLLLVHISPPPPPVFVFGWSPVYLHPPYLNIGWTGEPARRAERPQGPVIARDGWFLRTAR
jgi:hypothetical protein